MTDSSREFMGVALKTLVCAHHAPHAAHARGKPAGSQTCVSPLSPALGFNATAAGEQGFEAGLASLDTYTVCRGVGGE